MSVIVVCSVMSRILASVVLCSVIHKDPLFCKLSHTMHTC